MGAMSTAIQRGFDDPVHDSQRAFRAIMAALAEPGLEMALDVPAFVPEPLHPAAATILLTLCDYDTPVHLEGVLAARQGVRDFLGFNTGAPLAAGPAEAAFAVAGYNGGLPDPTQFSQGTAEYPDRSTTLILALGDARPGQAVGLRGPGIADMRTTSLPGIDHAYWRVLANNRAAYPLGIDVIFTMGRRIVGLPRSTRIAIQGG
ncbi:MAG: phosphonate C-P lyase system protein PhnH [Rhodobiaceae bacterium]|nr:phosphonate C-P lyase system protein PhnH [Rhodobiaceae bacterium]MCC0057378.1 phosphonate C-P lyase system protein PhnH [Rhodobiaceae bacterium]